MPRMLAFHAAVSTSASNVMIEPGGMKPWYAIEKMSEGSEIPLGDVIVTSINSGEMIRGAGPDSTETLTLRDETSKEISACVESGGFSEEGTL